MHSGAQVQDKTARIPVSSLGPRGTRNSGRKKIWIGIMRTLAFYYLSGTSPHEGVVCVLQTEWNNWRSQEEGESILIGMGSLPPWNKGPPCQVRWWEINGETWRRTELSNIQFFHFHALNYLFVCSYINVFICLYINVPFTLVMSHHHHLGE